MRSFLSKLFLYSILLGICLFITSLMIYRDNDTYYEYYEQENVLGSLNHFLDHKDHYNTVFIGSSKTYRHIIPLLFDSLTTNNTKSYNLASEALFPFRTFEVLDRAVANNDSLRTVVLELTPLALNKMNYNKKPAMFVTTPARTLKVVSMAAQTRLSVLKRVQYLVDYSRTFVYKYLGFGARYHFEIIAGLHADQNRQVSLAKEITANNGHLSLDEQMHLWGNESQKRKYAEFLANPVIIGASTKSITPDSSRATDKYTDLLVDYVHLLNARGIDVFFYISPRLSKKNATYIYDQKERLSQFAPVIDISSPEKYPALYSVEYSHDRSHLNSDGAEFATIEVAKQFNQHRKTTHLVYRLESPVTSLHSLNSKSN